MRVGIYHAWVKRREGEQMQRAVVIWHMQELGCGCGCRAAAVLFFYLGVTRHEGTMCGAAPATVPRLQLLQRLSIQAVPIKAQNKRMLPGEFVRCWAA